MYMKATKMTEYKEKIYDAATGETIWRNFTDDEIAEAKKIDERNVERITQNAVRELKRQSALNKLIDLGLTEEEIAALQANGRLFK